MKKSLENDLISLAHRVLQLRGREDLEEMKKLAGALYERLCILSFAEKHFQGPQPTIGLTEVEVALKKEAAATVQFEEKPNLPKQAIPQIESTEPKVEQAVKIENTPLPAEKQPLPEKEPEIPAFSQPSAPAEPITEIAPKEEVSKTIKPKETIESSVPKKEEIKEEPASDDSFDLRDIAVHFDDLPQFEPVAKTVSKSSEKTPEPSESPEKKVAKSKKQPQDLHHQNLDLFSSTRKTINDPKYHKPSLNETIKRGFGIGLNDRHAFIKNLFDGNQTDFKRVISQLNTFESYAEAKSFIEEQVKPDYNWENKEEYEERFYTVIEKSMAP